MGEIDALEHAKDQRETKGNHAVAHSDEQSVNGCLEQFEHHHCESGRLSAQIGLANEIIALHVVCCPSKCDFALIEQIKNNRRPSVP